MCRCDYTYDYFKVTYILFLLLPESSETTYFKGTSCSEGTVQWNRDRAVTNGAPGS